MKDLAVILTTIVSGAYFFIATFIYFHLDEIAPLVIAEGTAVSIAMAIFTGFGIVQFITIVPLAFLELISKEV